MKTPPSFVTKLIALLPLLSSGKSNSVQDKPDNINSGVQASQPYINNQQTNSNTANYSDVNVNSGGSEPHDLNSFESDQQLNQKAKVTGSENVGYVSDKKLTSTVGSFIRGLGMGAKGKLLDKMDNNYVKIGAAGFAAYSVISLMARKDVSTFNKLKHIAGNLIEANMVGNVISADGKANFDVKKLTMSIIALQMMGRGNPMETISKAMGNGGEGLMQNMVGMHGMATGMEGLGK